MIEWKREETEPDIYGVERRLLWITVVKINTKQKKLYYRQRSENDRLWHVSLI